MQIELTLADPKKKLKKMHAGACTRNARIEEVYEEVLMQCLCVFAYHIMPLSKETSPYATCLASRHSFPESHSPCTHHVV